jgi:hypothetical protein
MASVMLVHPEERLTVPVLKAINKCSLFQKNPALLAAPYRAKASVTLPVFRDFVSELEGNGVTVTDTNFAGLRRLCEEFGFDEFAVKLSKFRPSQGLNGAEDAEARGRIAALEEQVDQHSPPLRRCRANSGDSRQTLGASRGKSPHCGLTFLD